MEELSDREIVDKKQRDQMLQLVTKSFYNELITYGVGKGEILRVASHLLDNLLAKGKQPAEEVRYYNDFTLNSVKDQWSAHKRLVVDQVVLRPLDPTMLGKVARWLKTPAIRNSFIPAFPEKEHELQQYFADPAREYFGIYYHERPAGIVGGENIDLAGRKLEMKKLVGEPRLQGQGIGKRATFGFLYYAFCIRDMNKVYIHSRDINIGNINLNTRFGFELEGIFGDEVAVGNKYQDVVRMALFKSLWTRIFNSDT